MSKFRVTIIDKSKLIVKYLRLNLVGWLIRKDVVLLLLLNLTVLSGCSKRIAPSSVSAMRKQEREERYEYFYVEGLRNKFVGSPANAIALFEECIKIMPGRDGAWYQIGQIAYFTGDNEKALRYGKEALSLGKNIWHYMLVANAFYQMGNTDSAILYYEIASREFPDAEEIKYTLGNLYYDNGYYSEAAGIFRYFDDKYSMGGSSAIPLVRSLIKLNDYNEAENKLKLLITEYPDDYSFKGILAEMYRDSGQTEKAGELYEELFNSEPDNITLIFSLAEFFRKGSNYADLFSILNTVALRENLPVEEKVTFFASQLDDPAITENYSREFEISLMVLEGSHDNNPLVYLLRPELYSMTGRKKAAIESLEIYLKRWPDGYYAWEKILFLLADERDYERLYALSTAAVRRFNTALLPRIMNAAASTEIGLYDEALEQLGRARKLINDNKDLAMQILSMEADALYRKGDADGAFSKFDEALIIDQNDLVVLNNYAYFLAENNIRLKDALRMIEKVMKYEQDNNVYNDTYAWVLYKMGRYRKAEVVMRKIIESQDNDDKEYFEHFGYILKERKKCHEAVIAWERAIEMGSDNPELLNEIDLCKRRIK